MVYSMALYYTICTHRLREGFYSGSSCSKNQKW